MSYYRHLILSDPYLVSQVAYYPFDTATGANDLVGIPANNGTSSNMNYTNAGKILQCATFNGINSSIQIPNPVSNDFSFGTGSFSINFWIYRPSTTAFAQVFSKRDAVGNLEWQLNLTSGNVVLNLYSFNSLTNRIAVTSTINVPADVWTMVTLTFAGGTSRTGLKCYINSVERTSTALVGTYTSMSTSTASLWIGRQGNVGASWLNGRLDQTRIWKGRELNQTEITDIYNTLY